MSEVENKDFEVPYWREILKRLPKARSDWKRKKPLQKFGYLYGIGRLSMDAIAFPTFQNDQSLRLYTYLLSAYSATSVFLVFYTVIWYATQGEFAKGLPSTCMIFGMALSVSLSNRLTLTIE